MIIFAKIFFKVYLLNHLCVTLRPVDERSHRFLHDKTPTSLTAVNVPQVYMTILCIEIVIKSRGSGLQFKAPAETLAGVVWGAFGQQRLTTAVPGR